MYGSEEYKNQCNSVLQHKATRIMVQVEVKCRLFVTSNLNRAVVSFKSSLFYVKEGASDAP